MMPRETSGCPTATTRTAFLGGGLLECRRQNDADLTTDTPPMVDSKSETAATHQRCAGGKPHYGLPPTHSLKEKAGQFPAATKSKQVAIGARNIRLI